MIDMTSWVREKVFRMKPLVKPALAGEEVSEKQTTKMGYFLLFCMFFAVIISSQWALGIISSIPTKPTQLPYCVKEMIDALSKQDLDASYSQDYYSYYNDCVLTSTTPKFDFKAQYDALKPVYDQIQDAQSEISNLSSEKSQSQYRQDSAQDDYNTSLHEKNAQIDKSIYDAQNLQNDIQYTRQHITTLEEQISQLKSKISALQDEVTPQVLALHQAYIQAQRDYKNAFLLYRLITVVLSFVFSLTIFFLLYRFYTRHKIANSPSTIIFSVATFAYGLIVLQIAGLFLWDILPHKLVHLIVEFLGSFTPLLFLVQFLWPVLIVGFFGFIVYKIQKRLYSPSNVLKRFVSDKKCPHCGNAVDITKPFCPLCSHEIQVHCPHCQSLTLKGMPYCSSCGGKNKE